MDAVDPLGAAEFAAFGQTLGDVGVDQPLDILLDLVGQLVAVRPEQLDAVVVERIMRRRDHHAEIGAHRAGQHGDRRRRHRPEQQHVHADRGEARDQRGLDHVAGQPGILADHHPMAMLAAAEHEPGRLAGLECQFRRDHAIGAATNAVSAKILAGHNPHRLPFLTAILTPSPCYPPQKIFDNLTAPRNPLSAIPAANLHVDQCVPPGTVRPGQTAHALALAAYRGRWAAAG